MAIAELTAIADMRLATGRESTRTGQADTIAGRCTRRGLMRRSCVVVTDTAMPVADTLVEVMQHVDRWFPGVAAPVSAGVRRGWPVESDSMNSAFVSLISQI